MSRPVRFDAYTVYLLYSFAMALFTRVTWAIALVYQVERVGLGPFQIVLIGTALEASYFLFEVPTGVVADAYSRRLSVIIGTFMLGGGFIMMGAVPDFWVILASQLVCGIGYTFLSGAEEAWIADEIGEERTGSAFVRGAQVSQVGRIIGIPIAMVLGWVDMALPIIVGGVAVLGLGGFLIIFMRETNFTRTAIDERETWSTMKTTFTAGVGVVRAKPVLLTIIAVALFFGIFSEGWDRLAIPRLLDGFTFPHVYTTSSVIWVGAIGLVVNVVGIVLLEGLRRTLNLRSHKAVTRTLAAMNLMMIAGVITFALAGNVWLAIGAMIFADTLNNSFRTFQTIWINQSLSSGSRATVMSFMGQSDSLGQTFGGPAIGAVGSLFGLRWAMIAAGGLLVPILAMFGRALGQKEAVVDAEAGVTEVEL